MGDDRGLAELVRRIADEPAYAIDTEFHRERSYFPHLALVQVAWADGAALVDPLAVDVAPLGDILAGPGVAVAHAADQDLDVLERACGALPSRLFDTQLAAGFLGHVSPSLATLTGRILGVTLPKASRLTDWTRRPLAPEHQRYAADDVAHLLGLRESLGVALDSQGRLAWAEEECEILRLRRRAGPVPEQAWWRVKDARGLRGRARGVAQTVAAWRERTAAERDQPVRFVLSDMAILAVAHHPPADVDVLRALRGVDGRHLRRGAGDDILAAVARGLELKPDELCLPPSEDLERGMRPAVTLATAWAAQLGADLDLDPALVATRADVAALVRGDDGRLSRGWRRDLVGAPLRHLLAGDAALAFAGKGRLTLERRSHEPF